MTLWLVRAGRHGEQEHVALEQGLACIGYQSVPSLASAGTRDKVEELVKAALPDAGQGKVSNVTGQLHAFRNRMELEDLVALPLKTAPKIAFGKVTGPYQFREDLGEVHHTRSVDWIETDIPRTRLKQDLLYSLGAFMTVCQIERNDAEARVEALLRGLPDPGPEPTAGAVEPTDSTAGTDGISDVERLARDQILGRLETDFKGHELSRLVEAVLRAEGYVTELSAPGPDGGVDILCGRGALGFEVPRLCVQVKSAGSPADVGVFRGLQGSMATFKADQGLLVSWGGFTSAVEKEARLSYFSVRLWDADDLVEAVFRNYERLPEEIRSDLPLKRIWALVLEE